MDLSDHFHSVLSWPYPGCGRPREESSPCYCCSQEGCSLSLWSTAVLCRSPGQFGSLLGPCQGNQDPWRLEISLPFPLRMPDKNRRKVFFKQENGKYLSSMCGPFEIKFQMHLHSGRKEIFHNHKSNFLLTSLKRLKIIIFTSRKQYYSEIKKITQRYNKVICICTW